MTQDTTTFQLPGDARTYHRHRILVVLLIQLGMSLLAVSSVNVALDTIQIGLGASSSQLQWVLSGYALAFGVLLIPAGRLGDVRGRGSMFVVGVSLFTLGCLGSGLAPTPEVLNIARVMQGIGAGLQNPQTIGMIQQYFHGPARAFAFSLFGVVVNASAATGPLVTGALIGALGPQDGWRWSFLINVPLGVVGIVLALRWFPFQKERARALARRARRGDDRAADQLARWIEADPDVDPQRTGGRLDLDPVGTVLMAAGVLGIMLPFMMDGSAARYALVAVGVLVMAVWVWWEDRYAANGREPLVDLSLFRFPSFANGTLLGGLYFLASAALFVVLALFLQHGAGWTPFQTGLIGLPNAIASAFFAWWVGRYVLTRGRAFIMTGLAAIVLAVLASILIARLAVEGQLSAIWLAVPLALMGYGQGVFGSCNQTLALEDVPPRQGGTAGGVKSTSERLGTAIGTAVVTGVYFGVGGGVDSPQAAADGFTWAFVLIAALLGVAMVIAVLDWRIAGGQPTGLGRFRHAIHRRRATGATRGATGLASAQPAAAHPPEMTPHPEESQEPEDAATDTSRRADGDR